MNHLEVGQAVHNTSAFDAADVREYEALTGDVADAPGTIPVGILGGMFSELLGTRLPGRGTNWLKQRITFERPALIDDPLTATVEIVRIRSEKSLVNLTTICRDGAGRVVCKGEALVLVKELESR